MTTPRTVLLTGASSGFGHGAARALAARGHRVFASMRGVDGKNAAAAAALRAFADEGGHALTVVEIDVTDDASVARGVAAVVEAAGAPDVLVNNAGVGCWGPQEAFTPEQVLGLFDVNVVGPLRMNRAALPAMRAAGGGCVIYVSSGLGRILLPFLGPYNATKHAVEAIAETGSYELALGGIETAILQPGAYGTTFHGNAVLPADDAVLEGQPALAAFFKGFAAGFEKRIAEGHLGDPQDIIDAMVGLVEAEPGTRPLRTVVGDDVAQGVNAVNQASAAVQGHILGSMGLR